MSWSSGDWICNACQNVNFKKREACHRCAYPKYGGPDPSTYTYTNTEALAGDWYCTTLTCGAHNYASRPNCFKCGAFKSAYPSDCAAYQYGSDATIPPGWKSGDWICPRMGCGVHNYASRTECFKCKTPRDFGKFISITIFDAVAQLGL
ncbi:zinc finger Ran-binding domain-containing protein 2-like isoform X1 [Cucurbita moschata]|uniref:Zinc finger Ran-binding domain-containing protein 2-like isoform X1 n=1 Tax=Cucurbita moschata TaxID=3662 RepID=A0A6J1EUC5_CUCMO|nr:zinc finger Ran-binding domain-containing protein 2-like isoform X1 [Cucurbita moschata]